ncbi:MAG: carboxymuconolactone decarboxylase family protein [Chloroflexi bacterium]|nr:carboxymuconolactone decarboxylase family protein [Chloroflexota bacterium]
MDSNSAGSRAAGASDEKIAAVAHWQDSELFSPEERAAFAIAEAMTNTPAHVTDALFAEARQFFSEAQMVELAATAAMENYRARFNRVFDVPSQDLYRPGAPQP